MKRNKQKRKQEYHFFPKKVDDLKDILESKFENNSDLICTIYEQDQGKKAVVFYILYMVDLNQVKEYLLDPFLSTQDEWSTSSLENDIPIAARSTEKELEKILEGLLIGETFIYVEGDE